MAFVKTHRKNFRTYWTLKDKGRQGDGSFVLFENIIINALHFLRIIHNSAVAYKNNLLNNNVMFVASNDEASQLFETKFLPSNFKHLTGIITNLNSTRFFEAAFSNKLKESDIDFARDGTTKKSLMSYILL